MDNETNKVNFTLEDSEKNCLLFTHDENFPSNSCNSSTTIIGGSWNKDIKPVLDYLMVIILVVIMLAMGCEITWRSLWQHVKRPIGLCIGIISQFVIVPLSSYLILTASDITGLHATGVLIISCCPGGVLSNTFTYFCEGDLSLSVAMTCASTVMALCMMPANIWLYGRSFNSENLVIPYQKMALSLISVTSPVVAGMTLKWKFPKAASVISKLGSYCGVLIMFFCIVIEVVVFPNMFTGIPLKLYAVILTLPLIGLSLGFSLATLLQQRIQIRKTISIECGVQNVPIALTIIAMSFPLKIQEEIVLLPWLYGFAMMTACSIICITYQFCYKKNSSPQTRENPDSSLERGKLYFIYIFRISTFL
ncbi:hypothetical protein TNCT_139361 [Trichonephila clavata]|uniref:Ileal sodium/bile acid cotransporter n=1 Tax=Trichonephila clavata TaxID=2740835 RepID=A0A8X6KIU4_TRICU|nr:hypothetical protein TNCT_139361 [Trichonephila clavata]